MSVIDDLLELAHSYSEPYVGAALERAQSKQVESTPPPVPYTGPSSGITWTGGQSRTSQLELSTAETTLFSVLELISKTTSRVKWDGHRPLRGAEQADQDRPVILPEQNRAVYLWNRPNNFMTGRYVRQMCTWHYRAVGEAWMVMDFYDAAMTVPRAWWPVRPDRMSVDADPGEFLTGYTYTGPSGEKIDLDQREVLRITNPHPLDPHRGMGVVQTLGTIIGMSLESAQWIANFFANDATPGGIIEIEQGLPDMEYNRLRKRWNEQHRGTAKAHRVAILEYGTFKPRSYSMKDMQFPEIRHLSRDQVLEAFRIHKHNMGISDDVNRANAVAAREQLAENETKPNLDEWYELGNGPYNERFGAVGEVVEHCYRDPTPEDQDAALAEGNAKVDNYVKLVGAGVEPAAASEYLGMPELPLVVVEPASDDVEKEEPEAEKPTSETPASGDLDETAVGDPLAIANVAQKLYLPYINKLITRVEGRQELANTGMKIDPEAWQDDEPQPDPAPPPEADPVVPEEVAPAPAGNPAPPSTSPTEGDVTDSAGHNLTGRVAEVSLKSSHARVRAAAEDIDLSDMAEDWQGIVDKLLARWPGILDDQYSELARQVRAAIDDGDLEALLELTAPDAGAADVLTLALVAAALSGATAVQREAEDQGVDIGTRVPDRDEIEARAGVVTGLMRAGLALSAGAEALRVASPGMDGEAVADAVREHLDSLTDAQPRAALGAAVTAAQNAGRFETLAVAPTAAYFASEQLDDNTCAPCRKVEGTRYDSLDEAKEDYPTAGYRKCDGGSRCRGTIVAIYLDTEDGDDK
jgi:HK97 family phage portal protein